MTWRMRKQPSHNRVAEAVNRPVETTCKSPSIKKPMQHSSADSKPPSPHLPAISGHNGYLDPVKSQRRPSQGYPSLEMLPTGLPSGENPGFLCVLDKSLVRTVAARSTAYMPPNSFSKYHDVTLLETWIISDMGAPSLINDGKKFPASNGSPPPLLRETSSRREWRRFPPRYLP